VEDDFDRSREHFGLVGPIEEIDDVVIRHDPADFAFGFDEESGTGGDRAGARRADLDENRCGLESGEFLRLEAILCRDNRPGEQNRDDDGESAKHGGDPRRETTH
jgi:hypothetical protein